MNVFGVNVLGVSETIAAIEGDIAAFETEVDALIQEAGQEAASEGESRAAVRTGLMKSEIAYIPGTMQSEAVSPVYYSIFVDQGTRKMAAQPFMTPAYDIASEHLKEGIESL